MNPESGPRVPRLMAASLGEAASEVVAKGGEGTVQGVYRGAVNIAMPGGLVSLVPEASGRGPINITVMVPQGLPMSSFELEAGDPVTVDGGVMDAGGRLVVSLLSASLYAPSLRLAKTLPWREVERNLASARLTGLRHGNLSGLGALLGGRAGRFAEARRGLSLFASAAAARIDSLVRALRRGDARLTREAVAGLVGLGPGLTPSADDMLAGMAIFASFHSRNSGSRSAALEAVLGVISEEARGRTTALSEAYLVQAAAGRGNEAVAALCEAVLMGGSNEVVLATRRLLGVGETSGTDTLLGVVLGGGICLGAGPQARGRAAW